jgi:5'-deoxynucleotidase YfbR-like HD superfamily hydrolase
MKNKKIVRLTENDINKLVKKIIAEGYNEEEKLIDKAIDLLVGYGYYQEEELPQDLEELNDILWSEWQKSDSIMRKKFDDLMYEIESYFSGYDADENYDHLVDPEDEDEY